MRWLRLGLLFVGAVAALSGIALLYWAKAPDTALGWVLLPLGGAALVLLEALADVGVDGARRVLTFRGIVLGALAAVLLATALAVAWTVLA